MNLPRSHFITTAITLITTSILLLLLTTSRTAEATNIRHQTSQYLGPHNAARRSLGLKPLAWDQRLASYARWYGNTRRGDCQEIHSNGPYGENLFWGAGYRWTPRQAVTGWLSEKRWYNRWSNTCSGPDCGHYTQIVWRATRRVGCARVDCFNKAGVLFVCEYDPPGNWFGERPY